MKFIILLILLQVGSLSKSDSLGSAVYANSGMGTFCFKKVIIDQQTSNVSLVGEVVECKQSFLFLGTQINHVIFVDGSVLTVSDKEYCEISVGDSQSYVLENNH